MRALPVLLFLPLLSAQEAPREKDATFSTDVKVVNVYATARDKQGKVISTLTKDDFTWQQDGAGNSYISTATTTSDPGTSYAVQKSTEQGQDQYGNVLWMKQNNYVID